MSEIMLILGITSFILVVLALITALSDERSKIRSLYTVSVGILSLLLLLAFMFYITWTSTTIDIPFKQDLDLVIACDKISFIVGLNVIIIGIITLLSSYRYMEIYGERKGYVPYYLATLGFIYSMVMLVIARTWLWFLFFLEIMTLSSYFLIGYEYYERDVARIAWNYFVIMHVLCTIPLIISVAFIYTVTGTFTFGARISHMNTLIALLSLLGFATKSGLFPIHFWLPDAHPVAPSPISALLSGAMVEIGVYGMYRVVEQLGSLDPMVANIIIVMAVLSTMVGVLSYVRQRDVKRLFAWSTIDNMGWMYIIIAFTGVAGGPLLASYILNHGLAKAAAFISSGVLLYTLGTKNLDELKGTYRAYRLEIGLLVLSMFALEGTPPFNFFWSKFGVVRVVLENNVVLGIVYALAWCIAFVIFLYIIHELISSSHDVKKTISRVRECPLSLAFSVAILLALLLISQILCEFLYRVLTYG
ncbi:MAG: hypothetical protein DRJ43_00140 [Thermoprotei archaeon]|nr:MAG: hypothetical protein DRJ43_00140 [Thermoprotei archaeon]